MNNQKTVLILTFIMVSIKVFGQINCNHKTLNSIFVDDSFLYYRHGSKKQYKDRIISQQYDDGKLILHFGFNLTHDGTFSCNVKEFGDTIKIIYKPAPQVVKDGYEEYIDASGLFEEVKMIINGLKKEPKIIFLNNKEIRNHQDKFLTYPEKYDIIDNDTINRIDKYGQKQGKWVKIDDYGTFQEFNYKDSELIYGKETRYYDTGEKWSEGYYPKELNSSLRIRRFYKTGEVLIEEYFIEKKGVFKRYWYETGTLKQENYFDGEQIILNQYNEDGNKNCKCVTTIGTEIFKGRLVCRFFDEIEIPCMYYNSKGEEIGEKLKKLSISFDLQ